MKKNKTSTIFSVLLCLVLFLAACGGSDVIDDEKKHTESKKCTVRLIADGRGHKFEVDRGTVLSDEQLVPNSSMETASSHFFLGWYTDAQLTNAFSKDTPITNDITLHGGYLSFSDAIIKFMRLIREDEDTIYYIYEIMESPYYDDWLYATFFIELAIPISVSFIEQVYDVDGTGKDNVYVKIESESVSFQWNIIKGNGAQIIYGTVSTVIAQSMHFSCDLDYVNDKKTSITTTSYYHGFYFEDNLVLRYVEMYTDLAFSIVNDVLLKDVADALGLYLV